MCVCVCVCVSDTRVNCSAVSVAREGEQLVKVVDGVHTDEAAYADAHQCCHEADQGDL